MFSTYSKAEAPSSTVEQRKEYATYGLKALLSAFIVSKIKEL